MILIVKVPNLCIICKYEYFSFHTVYELRLNMKSPGELSWHLFWISCFKGVQISQASKRTDNKLLMEIDGAWYLSASVDGARETNKNKTLCSAWESCINTFYIHGFHISAGTMNHFMFSELQVLQIKLNELTEWTLLPVGGTREEHTCQWMKHWRNTPAGGWNTEQHTGRWNFSIYIDWWALQPTTGSDALPASQALGARPSLQHLVSSSLQHLVSSLLQHLVSSSFQHFIVPTLQLYVFPLLYIAP